MEVRLWQMAAWLLAACILGFLISFIFAGRMRLPRKVFLIPYVGLSLLFLIAFIIFGKVDADAIIAHNWLWGVLVGLLVCIILVRHVRAQAFTRTAKGKDLALGLVWDGFAYGMMDALFLNVMPVVAVIVGTAQFDWAGTLAGKIGIAVLGLIASLVVAVAYHLGYPEFRSRRMKYVLLGNSIITLAFILSGNPLGSMISHTVMHIAAVLQGPDTTIQLPPHYQISEKQG